jgi:hypothetical protein
MGGENKAARLPRCLATIAVVWGIAAGLVRVAEAANDWHFDDQGRVQVDIEYDCSRALPTEVLSSAGLSATSSVRLASWCVVEGWIAPESLSKVASLDGVIRVRTPSYAVQPRLTPAMQPHLAPLQSSVKLSSRPSAGSAGSINHNGVTIMRADQFVSQTGVNGAGVTVGVQSAGISSLHTIQSRGELPAVQLVLPDDGASSPAGDEGTALLQEIHAVAPGAGLAYCGPNTFVEYTSCLSQLIGAGATILVDDLIFPQQDLLSSNSPAVQAIEQLLTGNPAIVLFTAGGNYNGSYWEGAYSPVALSSPFTCTSGTHTQTDYYVAQFDADRVNALSVMQSFRVPFAFAWEDSPGQNSSEYDLYWFNGNTQVGCLGAATTTDIQITQNVGLTAGTYNLYIGTPDVSSAGKFLKLWVGGDGLTSLSKSTTGSVVTAQAFAAGAVTIGAVNGSDGVGNNIEPFSSLGPITLTFPDVKHIQSPVLVAPDGINVDAAGTYFQGNLFPDGNFYGTSASAPNAAAVGALIRSAFPALTAVQLVATLKAGAVQLGSAVPDGTYGYGRVDAMGALSTFPTPTITSLTDASVTAGSRSESVPFTVTGSGPLHFSVTSSNTTTIPAAIVAAGSPGVTITPADCGVSTLTCTVSVMPANGPGGTITVTLAALDGANRSASASMKVNVTGTEPSPPANSTPEPGMSGGGGGGGGSVDSIVLALLLLTVLLRVARSSAPSTRLRRVYW